jgi:hypothetical protein
MFVAALLGSAPLHAQESFYQDHPDHGLRFADMEFDMPTDPLLPSYVGMSYVIHTPAHYLADATNRLRSAIPGGTDAATAAATLAKAGAHCVRHTGDALICRYRDVETPWDHLDGHHAAGRRPCRRPCRRARLDAALTWHLARRGIG